MTISTVALTKLAYYSNLIEIELKCRIIVTYKGYNIWEQEEITFKPEFQILFHKSYIEIICKRSTAFSATKGINDR